MWTNGEHCRQAGTEIYAALNGHLLGMSTELGCGSWLTRCYRTPYSARSKPIRRRLARFVQLVRQSCTIFLCVENKRSGSFAREYQPLGCQYGTRPALLARLCCNAKHLPLRAGLALCY